MPVATRLMGAGLQPPARAAERGSVVVMGPPETLAAANAERGGEWLAITRVG
jgi:hypothetical protein